MALFVQQITYLRDSSPLKRDQKSLSNLMENYAVGEPSETKQTKQNTKTERHTFEIPSDVCCSRTLSLFTLVQCTGSRDWVYLGLLDFDPYKRFLCLHAKTFIFFSHYCALLFFFFNVSALVSCLCFLNRHVFFNLCSENCLPSV